MRPPCEVVVQYLLPTFRSMVARELVEKYGFSQVKAAARLGTTQAAISQYLYSKRGEKRLGKLRSLPVVRSGAKEFARKIVKGKFSPFDAMLGVCNLCATLRKESVVCELHRESASLPDHCRACK